MGTKFFFAVTRLKFIFNKFVIDYRLKTKTWRISFQGSCIHMQQKDHDFDTW